MKERARAFRGSNRRRPRQQPEAAPVAPPEALSETAEADAASMLEVNLAPVSGHPWRTPCHPRPARSVSYPRCSLQRLRGTPLASRCGRGGLDSRRSGAGSWRRLGYHDPRAVGTSARLPERPAAAQTVT